jgi:hypothetical protein
MIRILPLALSLSAGAAWLAATRATSCETVGLDSIISLALSSASLLFASRVARGRHAAGAFTPSR